MIWCIYIYWTKKVFNIQEGDVCVQDLTYKLFWPVFIISDNIEKHTSIVISCVIPIARKTCRSSALPYPRWLVQILNLHLLIFRNYCVYCKSSFKSKEALLIHKEQAHRNIRCEHCNKLFIRQEHLSRHINKEHVKIFPDLICKECK